MSSQQSASRPEARNIAWTISRRVGMVIVLALAFFMSATITIYTLFRIGDTRVPDVIGKTEVEAQKLAEKAGLKVKITRRNDQSIPTDTVIETRPGPNSSVKKDSNLTIIVSSGPSQTKSENRINEGWFLDMTGNRKLEIKN
ncbi:MAG TPA: PASTA domain-containing protein [Blastocatellia bacterium]|nr:PASTA domain-containing protein [Blastocatellia bacterium]